MKTRYTVALVVVVMLGITLYKCWPERAANPYGKLLTKYATLDDALEDTFSFATPAQMRFLRAKAEEMIDAIRQKAASLSSSQTVNEQRLANMIILPLAMSFDDPEMSRQFAAIVDDE